MYCTIHQRIGYHVLYSTQQSRVDRLPCTVQYTRDSSNQVTMYSTVHNIGRVDRLPCTVQYTREQVTMYSTVHNRAGLTGYHVLYSTQEIPLTRLPCTPQYTTQAGLTGYHVMYSTKEIPLTRLPHVLYLQYTRDSSYSTQKIPVTWLPCTLQYTTQPVQTGYHLHYTVHNRFL